MRLYESYVSYLLANLYEITGSHFKSVFSLWHQPAHRDYLFFCRYVDICLDWSKCTHTRAIILLVYPLMDIMHKHRYENCSHTEGIIERHFRLLLSLFSVSPFTHGLQLASQMMLKSAVRWWTSWWAECTCVFCVGICSSRARALWSKVSSRAISAPWTPLS